KGTMASETLALLRRWKKAHKLILLVTGGSLAETLPKLPQPDLFALIIAENGCVALDPVTNSERLLAPALDPMMPQRLATANIQPLHIGRCVVSTEIANELAVTHATRSWQGMDLIRNRKDVILVPSGHDKGT